MLKKLLRSGQIGDSATLFPIKNKEARGVNVEQMPGGDFENSYPQSFNLEELAIKLAQNESFLVKVTTNMISPILEVLLSKYSFEPTDKYKEEIENKKKYINQLDEYLYERKEINHNVENELQQFLNETTQSINKALEVFSQGVQTRILEAEGRHGIDKIKEVILKQEAVSES